METFLVAVLSAGTSVLVTLISIQLTFRQQRQAALRTERQDINARYLNPLRLHLVENHFRLSGTLKRVDAEGGQNRAQLVVDDPVEVSAKDAAWFNSDGCALMTSVYLTSGLFAQLKKVREDLPYLKLSGADDTRLAALILGVQRSYLQDDGVFYITQPSIGEDLWIRDQGRLRTYREFCELMNDPTVRVWFDRLLRFHLDTAAGAKRERAQQAIAAMRELTDFLDRCVGGGTSIGSRFAAEGITID